MEDKLDCFRTNGYFHAKNLLPKEECDRVRQVYLSNIKTCDKPKLRQRSVTFEPHKLSPCGFVENALLDVHRNDLPGCSRFSESVHHLLSDKRLTEYIRRLLNARGILVQTMYFESSRGTIPHFDKYFLSVNRNNMLGMWIALEDIGNCSGRFFIYPNSHRNSLVQDASYRSLLEKYKKLNAIAIGGHQKNSRRHYVRAVIDSKKVLNKIINAAGWKKKHPTMKKGNG